MNSKIANIQDLPAPKPKPPHSDCTSAAEARDARKVCMMSVKMAPMPKARPRALKARIQHKNSIGHGLYHPDIAFLCPEIKRERTPIWYCKVTKTKNKKTKEEEERGKLVFIGEKYYQLAYFLTEFITSDTPMYHSLYNSINKTTKTNKQTFFFKRKKEREKKHITSP